jgi:predicted ATPase/DNA-binding winged helix-turn-helix (wHTH) protein
VDSVIFECGSLRIDPTNRRLTRNGCDVGIEPKAFAVLLLLLERADELVTRDELLDSVWGHRYVTPATLNRVMTLLRRVFGDDADHPRWILTVHRGGYRFIGTVQRAIKPHGEARAHFGPPPNAQLPAKLEPLIGRERELSQVCTMLAQHRSVTIIGPGGMGKTQCALEAARLCSGRFPDGVWFFDLSPLERAHDWLVALAGSLSVPAAGTRELLPRVAAALSGRQALLLIDNCDHLAADMGAIVLALLRVCAELKILATSQQQLDFVGEHLMWLPPLALPPPAEQARRIPLEEVAATPAVELLLTRAAAVQAAIALNPNNVVDIVEICRRLEGMPLALEMAAAQFAMLSPAAIREHVQQHYGLLASVSAGRERRHQTLQALVDWSYGLLSSQEQRLLCWLGVFLQGWTVDAAEHFGEALGIQRDKLLQLHSGLIVKSLVVVDPTLSPPRYRLLETVRAYALQYLRARAEEADARNAHLMHFVQLGERSHRAIVDSHADEWLERLLHEHANIDGALGWARSTGADPQAAMRLVGSLMLYGKYNSQIELLANWTERALEGVTPEASSTYLRALLCRGMCKVYMADSSVESQLVEAVALAGQIGDRWAQGCAAAFLAMWQANLGRLEPAGNSATLVADIAEAEADDWLRSLAGLAKAWIALGSNRHQDALAALQPIRGVGFDLHQHQMVEIYLALSHYRLRNWREAAEAMLDAIENSVRTRNLRSQAAAMEAGAYLAMHKDRPEVSARLLGKANDIRERTRLPLFSFWLATHEEAMSLVPQQVGRETFSALYADGAQAREELVVEETRELLREVAGDQAVLRAPMSD